MEAVISGGASAVMVVALLSVRAMAAVSSSPVWRRFSQFLTVVIGPLVLVVIINAGLLLLTLIGLL
jgi:hypothetical protein